MRDEDGSVMCRAQQLRCASDPTTCGGHSASHNAWSQDPAAEICRNKQGATDGEAWLLPSGLSSSAGLQELQKLGMTAASG